MAARQAAQRVNADSGRMNVADFVMDSLRSFQTIVVSLPGPNPNYADRGRDFEIAPSLKSPQSVSHLQVKSSAARLAANDD